MANRRTDERVLARIYLAVGNTFRIALEPEDFQRLRAAVNDLQARASRLGVFISAERAIQRHDKIDDQQYARHGMSNGRVGEHILLSSFASSIRVEAKAYRCNESVARDQQ